MNSHARRGWQYRVVGSGPEPILWLTGALGSGDLAFRTTPLMGENFSLLIPDYPAVTSLADACDGLAAIMEQEKIADAHIVGGSLGGMIAQHFARRYPPRVRSLVLSHTAGPELSRVKARMAQMAVGTLGLWPGSIVRSMFSRRLRGSFDVGDPFWLSYFDEAVASQSVKQLVSRVKLVAEFAGRSEYRAGDLSEWRGRILILESDDDPMMPEAVRTNLRRLYPAAKVYTFTGTGHSISLTDPARYVGVVRDFLGASRSQDHIA